MTFSTYHFISGLPRSGSTLLAALLRQNPRFHASMSSPVYSMVSSLLPSFSTDNEFSMFIDQAQRKRLIRGLFDGYYGEQPGKEVIFDTNRGWTAHMPLLHDQFPGAKVLACVRNVGWIMDSMERRFRANPYELTRLFKDPVERNTVYSRVDTLGQRNRMVGYAWAALKEACYGEHASSLLLIDYDLLAQAPDKVMPLVYQFLGEPAFEHDFSNVAFDAPEFDAALGVQDLHKVRPQVSLEARESILPPDLFAQYAALTFWNDLSNSAFNVICKPTAS